VVNILLENKRNIPWCVELARYEFYNTSEFVPAFWVLEWRSDDL